MLPSGMPTSGAGGTSIHTLSTWGPTPLCTLVLMSRRWATGHYASLATIAHICWGLTGGWIHTRVATPAAPQMRLMWRHFVSWTANIKLPMSVSTSGWRAHSRVPHWSTSLYQLARFICLVRHPFKLAAMICWNLTSVLVTTRKSGLHVV